MTVFLDFSIYPNIVRKLQHILISPFITHHFLSKKHQKNLWELPYFCLGCLLNSAIVTSFSQLHLSRNSDSK